MISKRFGIIGGGIFMGLIITVLATGIILGSDRDEERTGSETGKVNNPEGDLLGGYESAEVAVLAGGCFWGVEAVFSELKGVYDVVSGYSGGEAETASYKIVGSGTTNHAESVKVIFDPAVISYQTILEIFFKVAHNPTEYNFQGPDIGRQYRSAIFYINEEQKTIAEEMIKELEKKHYFKDPIVTEITPFEAFYSAEEYHQNFMEQNPDHPYIACWDRPKLELLKKLYPKLIKK